MTIDELIGQLVLAKVKHGNRRVLLSKDRKGSAFRDITALGAGRYDGEDWVYVDNDFSRPPGTVPVLVLWPTN